MTFGTDIWNLKRKNPFVGVKSNKGIPYFLPQFTLNWHLDNAFSVGVLKHFSDVGCGLIKALHSSNDVPWWPPSPECQKRGMARVM